MFDLLLTTPTVSNPDALETLVKAILAAGIAAYVMCIVWYVLQVIANWRIFTKAGEKGWKSIIPVYNTYITYKIAWKPVFFWIFLIATAVAGVCSALMPADASGAAPVLTVLIYVALVVGVVMHVVCSHKLSKAFGHGIGFTLGLIFLNPIFLLILGLGGSQYQGADR